MRRGSGSTTTAHYKGYVRDDIYRAWHEEMQRRGIYFHSGQTGRWFLSTEHTEADIDQTIAAAKDSMRAVARRIPPTRAAML